ncbi:MAG: methylenetetrahydrofolate reductase [Caulobacteraceae bacterium]
MASSLREKLKSGQFVMTAEVTPPLSSDPKDLLDKAGPLKGYADAVNVTDGASARTHLDSLIAATILLQNGIEPILQLTCRDRNRIALQSEIVGAAAMGIHNMLVLTGDDPKKGDQPDAKPVFDLDSTGLVKTIAHMRDHHELLHGRKVGGELDLFVGVADAPIDPPEGWTPKKLQEKVEAGGQFAQTQFCMDTGVVRRYMQRLADNGLAGKIHFLIGVAPMASARSGRWMKENLFGTVIPDAFIERMDKAEDQKAEGQKIAVEVMLELAEIPGVSGAHIMAPLNEAAIPGVVDAVRAQLK